MCPVKPVPEELFNILSVCLSVCPCVCLSVSPTAEEGLCGWKCPVVYWSILGELFKNFASISRHQPPHWVETPLCQSSCCPLTVQAPHCVHSSHSDRLAAITKWPSCFTTSPNHCGQCTLNRPHCRQLNCQLKANSSFHQRRWAL